MWSWLGRRAVFLLCIVLGRLVDIDLQAFPRDPLVVELDGETINQQLDPNHVWFILAYATFTKEARAMVADWNQLARLMRLDQPNLKIARFSVKHSPELARRLAVPGVNSRILIQKGGLDLRNTRNFAAVGNIAVWRQEIADYAWEFPAVQLRYFGTRGRAEAIRLLLAATDREWTEEVVGADWPALKQAGVASGDLPFGQLPAIVEGNRPWVQSQVILRLLASAKGLYPAAPAERWQVDVLLAGVEDLRGHYSKLVFSPDAEHRLAAYVAEVLPMWLGYFEAILSRNGKWLYGSNMTVADLSLFDTLAANRALASDCLDGFPKLFDLFQNVLAIPSVRAYVHSTKRPAYQNGDSAFLDNRSHPSTYWTTWLNDFPLPIPPSKIMPLGTERTGPKPAMQILREIAMRKAQQDLAARVEEFDHDEL